MNQTLCEPNCGVSLLELYRYYASYTVILEHSVQCSMTVGATTDALPEGSQVQIYKRCSVCRQSTQFSAVFSRMYTFNLKKEHTHVAEL